MQAAPLRMRTALPRMQAAIHCDMSLYLQARNIRKTYGDVVALEDASLDVREGEILALLGPNGAGKTTFIKILATLLLRDSGSINVLGYDMDTNAEAIRHAVGYVGQDTERSAYARLTVRENLVFFGRLRGLADTVIDAQIHKFSGHFDFDANLDKQFVTLSGGQKQTAVIMRALLHEPPLVYLDEPTKGLDPIVARRIRNFLRQLVREDGASLLLTSHMLSEVDELADRVALIHRGSIPIVGAPKRLKRAVGAAEFIEIESDALPDDVRAEILSLEPVLFELARDPQWVSFAVSDAMIGAEAIIRTLRTRNITAGFRQHSTTLEDAFLHYIGEISERFDR